MTLFYIYVTDADHDPNAALPCDPQTCRLPDCFCSRDATLIPSNMELSQVEFVMLVYDKYNTIQ
jgi:hypothetical protein